MTDRRLLVDGAEVWKLHATHGLPLEISIPMLADAGHIPTWDRLVEAAERDGTNRERLMRRLHDIVGDAFDVGTAAAIREALPLLRCPQTGLHSGCVAIGAPATGEEPAK